MGGLVSNKMDDGTSVLSCGSCGDVFGDLGDAIEHYRKTHDTSHNVKRPSAVGDADSHGHVWYCFCTPCSKNGKDHRSFDSDEAMLDHLLSLHRDCDINTS